MNNNKKNPVKVIFGHKGSCIWSITTVALVALMATFTALSFNRSVLGGVWEMILGGDRAVTKDGAETSDKYQLSDDVTKGDKSSTKAKGLKVSNDICDEGMVLLKNKANALPEKNAGKVSVFGHNSVNMAISGSGSAANSADTSSKKTIFDSLEAVGYQVNGTLKEFYESGDAGGERSSNPGMDAGGAATLDTGETPVSNYTDKVKNSFTEYNDMAVIVLTRIGGEGFDLPRVQSGDSSKTFLDLDSKEKAMIDMVTSSGFKKVVVLINAANQLNCTELEQNDKVDAVLWMGFPGIQGVMSVGRILHGDVNPSGHLVDTYVKDFKSNPSYNNFGDNGVTDGDALLLDRNGSKTALTYYCVDYEEGNYVGYRYYETRYETEGDNGDAWYSNNVLYPFGYGLSYTSFDWNVENQSELAAHALSKDTFDVKVRVENKGEMAGKDVVQIYMGGQYTSGGIEKSAKVLVGFAKTGLINPGESETVSVTIDPYYAANYDFTDANKDGFSGYELEKGAYSLFVANSAHDSTRKITMNLADTIKYETDPITGTKVENHFEDTVFHTQTTLSRDNWEGTWPQTPTEDDRTISQDTYKVLKNNTAIDTDNPILNDESVTMPTFGKEGTKKALELQGKDFDDPAWDDLLDQVTKDEALELYLDAGYVTQPVKSISLPNTTCADGPVGLNAFMGTSTVYDTVIYQCEVISASSWNVDLIEKMGEAVGDEGLMGNVKGDGLPYTGWYAPGLNIHRNPFGGRCCEYFSEDPFLSGMMGAAEVKGAQSKGMVTFLKHFVGNEGETNRDTNGDITSVNEQALREIYLKPFEMAVKIGGTKGIMTSFNRLGSRWSGSDYSLLTTVLRKEWGFHGAVITDFNTHHTSIGYMQVVPELYAGGTLDLCSQIADTALFDFDSAKDMTALRTATHETLYAIINSNAMANEVDHYNWAYWKIALVSADAVIAVALAAWGVLAIRSAYKAENAVAADKTEN